MIKKMSYKHLSDYNLLNESFIVFGRIIPKYEKDTWTYTEEIFAESYMKQYDNEDIDISYVEEEDKVVFLYYINDICVGRIKLRSNWNRYALIENIGVSTSFRQKGIGAKLMEKAVHWAQQHNLIGLMLETQDINLSACRFYMKNNFIIGGVDTMLYASFPTANEKAIFYYYKF